MVVGWASGFLIAIAWGATRANNPRLASTLSGWAIAGMVVTGLLLLSIAVSDRSEARRATRTAARAQRETERAATEARDLERRSAARLTALEARLAREQEELDAAIAFLAAAELAGTGHVGRSIVDLVPDPDAAQLEPMLRQEVVDAVAELVGKVDPVETAALAGELEALLEKAH